MAYKGAMRTLTINGNTYQVSGDGLTAEVKEALLNCFEHVAWTDEHGQDYVDALEAALYPPANLLSISAVYTQSGTVYETDTLDSLKPDLVVTAYYDDGTSEAVTNYTLSGTLVGGTSTITVTYGGKTTTFTVNVYQPAELVSISAVYTQSGTVYDTDSLDSLKADLVVTALYDDQSTATITNYTLSGTLIEGTSTITVTYGEKTTTFAVTVTHQGTSDMDGWTDGVAYTNLDVVSNEYVQSNTGAFISYNGWDRTGYIPCDGAATIDFPPTPHSTSGSSINGSNAFYAADKSRISRLDINQSGTATVTVPANAAYFAISGTSADVASCIATGIVPHA